MTGMAALLFWSQTVLRDVHRPFRLARKECDGGWGGLKSCGASRRSLSFDFERPCIALLEVNCARGELPQSTSTLCDLAQRSLSRRGRVPALGAKHSKLPQPWPSTSSLD